VPPKKNVFQKNLHKKELPKKKRRPPNEKEAPKQARDRSAPEVHSQHGTNRHERLPIRS
jgi:hypothetical protein